MIFTQAFRYYYCIITMKNYTMSHFLKKNPEYLDNNKIQSWQKYSDFLQ